MKANNGILIIDDFGRQIISPQFLLNRWIVPLDRRVDYLTLRYGVKFQIPFEMIVLFSTNLDPNDLADPAFLRRIQNKIYVEPVNSEVFDKIFYRLVEERNLTCEPNSAAFLRELCQSLGSGDLQACIPADIIEIVTSIDRYEERPLELSKENLRRAAMFYKASSLRRGIKLYIMALASISFATRRTNDK
jgi:SpoVK/Ycf46/Vps4 family AAA+-type ATPase